MRRPASRPVSVTKRTTGDTASIVVRAGDKELGSIASLASDAGDMLSGNFSNRPAFTDFAEAFRTLADALQPADAFTAATARASLDAASIGVWHSVHDMRIDEPGTLSIAGGRARFRANAAYLMMRTGGL